MYILALASAPRGPYTTPSSQDEVATVFTDDELARLVTDFSQAGLLEPADGERLRDALGLGTRPVGGLRRHDHGCAFLLKHGLDAEHHPPLWIGKELYTPGHLVHAAVLGALIAARR